MVISKTSICTGLRILVTVVVGCSLRIVIIGSFIFIGHPVIIDSRFIIGAVIIGQRGVGIFAAVVAVRTIVIVVFCGIIRIAFAVELRFVCVIGFFAIVHAVVIRLGAGGIACFFRLFRLGSLLLRLLSRRLRRRRRGGQLFVVQASPDGRIVLLALCRRSMTGAARIFHMRQFQILLIVLIQRVGFNGHIFLFSLFGLFFLSGSDIVAALGALQLINRGFAGFALVGPAFGGDEQQHTRSYQQQPRKNQHRQQNALDGFGHCSHAGVRDRRHRSRAEGGIRRGFGRGCGSCGRGSGHRESDLDLIAFKGQGAFQRVLGSHGKAELARHGQRRIA